MPFGPATLTSASGAVSDLFAAKGHEYKARGYEFERKNYDLAADFADRNVVYSDTSTKIKQMQLDRQLMKSAGTTEAQVAGAGFAASGSALDIMSDAAMQGALTKSVTAFQGGIQEEGYKEQAQSYRNMSEAAGVAIEAEKSAAFGSYITGGIKAAAGVASLFTGGMSDSITSGLGNMIIPGNWGEQG